MNETEPRLTLEKVRAMQLGATINLAIVALIDTVAWMYMAWAGLWSSWDHPLWWCLSELAVLVGAFVFAHRARCQNYQLTPRRFRWYAVTAAVLSALSLVITLRWAQECLTYGGWLPHGPIWLPDAHHWIVAAVIFIISLGVGVFGAGRLMVVARVSSNVSM